MQQIAEVAEGSWLHSWPDTKQEEVEDLKDTIDVYEVMNGMCDDEGVKDIRGECQDTRYLPLERKEE